jgi:hypothetical protein
MVVAAVVGGGGCRQLLGIEDRDLASDAGAVPNERMQFMASLPTFGELAPNQVLPAVKVRIIGPDGEVLTTRSAEISLQLLSVDPGARLLGTLKQSAVNGVATFDDLRISQAAWGLSLRASTVGIDPEQSSQFGISRASFFPTFRGSQTLLLSETSQHALAVDLDGDGDRDVIATQRQAGKVAVFQNEGNGAFARPVFTPAGPTPNYLAVGDLTGDGKIDLVVSNETTDEVSLLVGDGAGGFGSKTTLAVCDGPTTLALGDVTNDGRPDLLVECANATFVTFFRNTTGADGVLQLAPRQDLANQVGACGDSVALGDMNRDGLLDIVAGTYCQNLAVLLQHNTIPNTFRTAQPFITGGHNFNIALADLDGDGDLDLLSGSGFGNISANPVTYRLNTTAMGATTMAFAARVDLTTNVPQGGKHIVQALDLDGDGKREIVSAFDGGSNLLIYPHQLVSPLFGPRVDVALERAPASFELGDLDGDGREDVLLSVTNANEILILYTR